MSTTNTLILGYWMCSIWYVMFRWQLNVKVIIPSHELFQLWNLERSLLLHLTIWWMLIGPTTPHCTVLVSTNVSDGPSHTWLHYMYHILISKSSIYKFFSVRTTTLTRSISHLAPLIQRFLFRSKLCLFLLFLECVSELRIHTWLLICLFFFWSLCLQ